MWAAGVADAIGGRSFVWIGSGVAQADRLRALGADVRAVVSVVAQGAPDETHATIPVLSLTAPTPSWLVMQAEAMTATLLASGDAIARLLDEVDPDRAAVVLGNVTVPAAATGGRTSWAPDAILAGELESKRAGGAPLADVVPWVPSMPAPAVDLVDERWWDDTTGELRAERLVVQRVGPGAGGITTWVCGDPAAAADAVGACGDRGARVSPFLDGVAVNVMACVVDDGVVVLPPTRQIVMTIDGQPIYAGNDTADCPASGALVEHTRAAGRALAARGYRGTFGLDAIVTPDGRASFHDLNPRINGAVHAFDLRLPAYLGLVTAAGWMTADAIPAAEHEAAASVDEHPLARWSLTVRPTDRVTIGDVPAPATCDVDVDRAALVRVGDHDPAAVGGDDDRAVVRPRVAPGMRLTPGVDVTVGALWCNSALSARLLSAHGSDTSGRLAASFLAGFR